MGSRITLIFISGLSALGCSKLEVNVGKKSKSDQTSASASQDSSKMYLTWNSMEDNLGYLDQLKSEGADALIKLYHNDGRNRVRTGFRHFRDAVVREATYNDGQSSLFPKISQGSCAHLEKQDLLALEGYGDIRELLGTAFLARLKVEDAPSFHAGLPEKLDEVTRLAFFEFGIGLDGVSSYQIGQNSISTRSEVNWKVIHEQSDLSSLEAGDMVGVRFSFARSQRIDGKQSFELSALAGPQVYEKKESGPLPAMALSYTSLGQQQSLILVKGLRLHDGSWHSVSVSRRITLVQRLANGDILDLTEINRYGLGNETTQSYTIKIGASQICVDGDHGGESPELPPGTGHPQNPPTTDIPSQNKQDNPGQKDD